MKSPAVHQLISTANADQLHEHLLACDAFFEPPLSSRLDIRQYAEKLNAKAHTFEAWEGEHLVGLVAVYVNRDSGAAFVSNVSTVPGFQGRGIASSLLEFALDRSGAMGCLEATLEVSREASGAIALYRKLGFSSTAEDAGHARQLKLTKSIRGSESA